MGKVKPCKDGQPVYQPQIHASYADHLPKITCVKCGREFIYRGTEDDEALALGAGVCSECKRMMQGGLFDGMNVGDLHDN